MYFVKYFIDRPIFAGVISILIVIAGVLASRELPLAEYPQVTPTTVVVRAHYPGANPETIADSVSSLLEREINGIDGLLYMTSHASGDGRLAITVSFAQDIDPEQAQIAVQNRVSRALARLPEEVQRQGVITEKRTPDMLMVVHMLSPDDSRSVLDVYNYALLHVKDELNRLEGVSDVVTWGAGEYSMRVWLNPDRMAVREITPAQVLAALRQQNVQVAAGTVGQPPNNGAPIQVALNAGGRLESPDQFEQIVIHVDDDGALTRLRDVARVEIGANQYALRSMLDNQPAVAMQIVQSTDSSALATAARVRARMEQLQQAFPEGIEYRIAYDPTLFVTASISNVLTTLLEAIALVAVVVVVFLKSWRAALIPMLAIPVSLVGTLAVMQLLGFTLNTLSLFGLVLSIGIVVDDAIVVVENVERHLRKGLSPRLAAMAAMQEVTRPIIAITSVLIAVFIPTAFLSGLTGQFYSQFALTIAISTLLSAFNSLTLSPALAAALLRPAPDHAAAPGVWSQALGRFDAWFSRLTGLYVRGVGRLLRASLLFGLIYVGLMGLTAVGFTSMPKGFVPAQDKYYLIALVQLPGGASLDRTESVVRELTRLGLEEEGIDSIAAFPGLSINGFVNNPAAAVLFMMLDPFAARTSDSLSANAIAMSLNGKAADIHDAYIAIFPPPPVPGLGSMGGFKMQVQDRADLGFEALSAATNKLIAAAYADGRTTGLFSSLQVNVPQIDVELDRTKALMLGVPMQNLYETLQVYLGSVYVNDFNMAGQTYQVYAQADAPFRQDSSSIGRLYTHNSEFVAVPLSALARFSDGSGPDPVVRYNTYNAADINGMPAAGVSSGDAITAMEQLAREHLPPGFTYEWTDLTFQEQQAGNSTTAVFALSVLFALLILAALYNSWTLPFASLLVVPTVLLSSMTGLWMAGSDINIFAQIGFVVLVGLASKNSILIVEFARQREAEGATALRAVLDAARMRLRPVIMTSLAFIMGVVPLALASGAGAEMRHAMGIAVLSGMLGVTLFGLLFTPLFYLLLRTRRSEAPCRTNRIGELTHV